MRIDVEKFLAQLKGRVLYNEPLSKHTWFGTGGPADVFFIPRDTQDLSFFLKNRPHDMPYYILGGGSNLLVRDGGIRGFVIKLEAPSFKKLEFQNGLLKCGAGYLNMLLKKFLIEHELGGLEFLCSIPGTIGGSIKSNAGCFSSCVSDVLISAELMDEHGCIKTFKNKDFEFSYRHCKWPENHIILSVLFQTQTSNAQTIQKLIDEQKAYREQRQPIHEKTAGSTFKNPQGLNAWQLIKEAGCGNLQIGGAKVSEKHANFLINTGTATSHDIETLGLEIVERVKNKTGITLEFEIQIVGQKA